MVSLRPLPQKRVNLVNEDDTRLGLPRKAEQTCHELVRLAEPLVRQNGDGDVDERSS